MVSKKEIAQVLKEAGLRNVSVNTNDHMPKSYKTLDNKFVKGIRGGSIGPMTMTDAHLKHNSDAVEKLVEKLRVLRPDVVEHTANGGVNITIQVSEKQNRVLHFSWSQYPSNAASMDLDPDYQTYWLTMSQKDVKR